MPRKNQAKNDFIKKRVVNVYKNISKDGRPYWKVFFDDNSVAFIFDKKVAEALKLNQDRTSFNPPAEVQIKLEQRSSGNYVISATEGYIGEPIFSGKTYSPAESIAKQRDDERKEIARMSILRSAVEFFALNTKKDFSSIVKEFESYVFEGKLPYEDENEQ